MRLIHRAGLAAPDNIVCGDTACKYSKLVLIYDSIIAVGYEARAKGVTRQMRGDDAKEKCPDIVLFQVPTANGKADLTR